MRIGKHSGARHLRTSLLAPHPCESQEEALFRSEAVDLASFFAGLVIGNHMLKRHQSDTRAAIIGGVLSHGERPRSFPVVHVNKTPSFRTHTAAAVSKILDLDARPTLCTLS